MKAILKTLLFILTVVLLSQCKKDELEYAASIELISGNNQSGEIESTLANLIQVLVKDQNGKGYQNTTVKFVPTDGTVSKTAMQTFVSGKAIVTWTLGSTIGTQTLTVTAYKADGTTALTGSPLEVNATATAPIRVSDIDGNTYSIIVIGNQIWMAENLKTTKFNDGTDIPLVTDNTEWENLTTPGYCWYNNDEASYKNTYGAIYNWHTGNTGKLCPSGWHIPTDEEWTTLTDYLGGENVAGGKLKEDGTTHWAAPNTGATNESGFTALPGGYRVDYDYFYGIGTFGYWWTSTEISDSNAWCRTLHYLYSDVYRVDNSMKNGSSVRCIRD